MIKYPVLIVALLLSALQARAEPEKRVALVIGNSQYANVGVLPNPDRDAALMTDALRRDGFAVSVVKDGTRSAMLQALNAFNDAADAADWALVYYAGHGVEVGGINYLIPTDARLRVDRDVQDEAIPLNRLLDTVANAKKLRLVILDACRNNPFSATMKRAIALRSVDRGLARPEPQAGILVVYSAEAGAAAADGAGDHSPFTAALVARLDQPGLGVRRLFDAVTADVLRTTNQQQRPYQYGSNPTEEEFYFKPPAAIASAPAGPTRDEQIWSFLQTSRDVASLATFRDGLAPDSPLRAEVDSHLAKLRTEQEASLPPPVALPQPTAPAAPTVVPALHVNRPRPARVKQEASLPLSVDLPQPTAPAAPTVVPAPHVSRPRPARVKQAKVAQRAPILTGGGCVFVAGRKVC